MAYRCDEEMDSRGVGLRLRAVCFISCFIIVLALLGVCHAAVYYIDWENGSDMNNGTSKSTPWKRAPGMRGCWVGDTGGNCNAKRAAGGAPGDQFILKGGVTWPKEALAWDWYFGSGTQANPIYFGVDQTWYKGASWTRPILDAQDSVPYTSPEGMASIMRAYGSWLVVDNIEFTGYAQLEGAEGCSGYSPAILLAGTSMTSKVEIKNNYFHGWSHGGTATGDCVVVLATALISEGPDMDLRIHDNVWDGSDTTKDMAIAYKGSAGHFYNNYIAYMQNGIVSSNIKYAWGNTFKNISTSTANTSCPGWDTYPSFDCTSHGNVLYTVGPTFIYNNYIDTVGGGVTIWAGPGPDGIAYVFNNVAVNDANQSLQISNYEGANESTSIYVWNNTFQGTGDGNRITGPAFTSFPYIPTATVSNNLMISTNNSVLQGRITTLTQSNNIGMTNEQAAGAGYAVTGKYPFCPPAQGGVTLGTGDDLRSLVAGIPSTSISDPATAALYDTSLGVNYDAVNHRIVGPSRIPRLRGTEWDIGAYEYESGTTGTCTVSGPGTISIGGPGTITIQ